MLLASGVGCLEASWVVEVFRPEEVEAGALVAEVGSEVGSVAETR